MGQYDQLLADASAKYKLPNWLLPAVAHQESGGNATATSPVGAQGVLQLMPATAKGLGVTDPYDPAQNIDAGAHYLRQQLDKFGTVPLALAAYNAGPGNVEKYGNTIPPFAETQRYVKNILAASGATDNVAPFNGQAAAGRAGAIPTSTTPAAAPTASTAILTALNQGNRLLGLPALPTGLLSSRAAPASPASAGAVRANPTPAVSQDAGKLVQLAPNADRAGVAIRPEVINIVGDIAAVYGQPLTIGTGTNHNEYVKGTRRESAHWTGWAADIPAEGKALTKLGYSALLAVGMDPQKAASAARTGGLFNVNGYQVIFKTNEGGNHWNHLHVGLAPSRQVAA